MTDEAIKRLEEIKECHAINYNFTSENWAGRKVQLPETNEAWLISQLEAEAQEVNNLWRELEMARRRYGECESLIDVQRDRKRLDDWAIRFRETIFERDKLAQRVKVLEDVVDSLLDGLDANADEHCGLSDEQWKVRIAEARAALGEEGHE